MGFLECQTPSMQHTVAIPQSRCGRISHCAAVGRRPRLWLCGVRCGFFLSAVAGARHAVALSYFNKLFSQLKTRKAR